MHDFPSFASIVLGMLSFIGGTVTLLVLVVLFKGFIQGYREYRAERRQAPQAPQDRPFAVPESHRKLLEGPAIDDPDANLMEFCPICHYHWTVCANIHTMHQEKVPTSIAKGSAHVAE